MSNAAKLLDGVLPRLRRVAGHSGGFDRWVDARRDQLVRSLDVLARRLRSQRREGWHADVGVVIPGARKHTWTPGDRITTADLVNVEQTDQPHRVVIKSNVLPGLDIEAERSRGVTPGAAWLKKKILDAVAAGPGLDQPKHRRLYVEGAEWLVQQLKPLKTPEEVTDFVDAWNEATRGRYLLPDVYSGADLKRMFPSGAHVGAGSDLVYNYSPEQLSELQTLKVQRKAAHAAGNKERLAELRDRQWKISDAARVAIQHGTLKHAGFAPMVKHRRDGTYQLYRQVPAEENTVGLQTLALAGVDGPSQDKVKRARLISLITNRPKLFGTPAAFWKEDVPFAIDLDKKGDWSKLGPKQKTEGSERSSGRWTRAATNQRRSGPPIKLPANLSGEDLLEAFGFRGIQYGNWVEDGSRGKYLPLAYEAFSDLADLLQQPRSFISHDGTLALAFGARGSGRASAHFEPSLQVVNLTHTRGDGSFAHEWAHFLDHELLQDPKAQKLLPGGRAVGSTASALVTPQKFRSKLAEDASGSPLKRNLAPQVAQALRELVEALHVPSPARAAELAAEGSAVRALYKEKMGEVTRRHRANELTHEQYREEYNKFARAHNLAPTKDRTTFSRDAEMLGAYFWTPTEMFARAFETWVEDKLQTQGRENTYLVYGTRVRYRASRTFREAFVEGLEPYPHGLERRSIIDAVDRLVQALALHGLPK